MKLPNTDKIKKEILKYANSNIFVKFIIGIIIWVIALIPVYVFYIIRWLIEPTGFWQEMAVFLVCALLFGWVQVIAFILGVALTLALILEDF